MKISKSFNTEKWDTSIEQLILSFWESRKIKLDKKTENYYEGNRGSRLGNFISYDMGKLVTKLSIVRNNNNEINCQLDIQTFGQLVTKYNKEFWELELATFESVVLKNDYMKTEWEKYNKSAGKKDILWTIGAFIFGVILYYSVKIFL